ncbi:MerR family transcriptional regulator [Lawsonia intracellularis]|uniref:Predicted transcriptional regulators n=1 Tax=Lawsonia intracellularis (strain PHE/MN1-00) TaxID=363253 RepID=Q1MRV3_LAWIP|nr:MerR family transcriptional regulator [Lawsonia intracellularis]AGC49623.1 MerR family transcriptional regulator [Lawsonia intracellularis N343]KAA0205130.1 MerR family transcriptional regulator [Lawsonia intracellularis]MBZ3892343.1 MerR family transcriptional regulator [Lawsonia intracellularis]OMQ05959.1 transcriptional regulator [Lawsonia intracellularis]RBN32323.1 MerR family transcriptional regulator [Lawsonia intracellularis]
MNERLYKIGEAARILELESYILRYWETEFSQLSPKRTPKGQRLYSETDIKLLFRLKYLLHEQGLTIEGARRVLSGDSALLITPQTKNKNETKSIKNETTIFKEKEEMEKLLDTIKTVEKELLYIKQLLNKSSTFSLSC